MSEQTITNDTSLSALAERAAATGNWWEEDALDHRNALALPTRVLVVLENAGITTVEELKAAGPTKLRELEGIGKLAFNQIVILLRALGNHSNGKSDSREPDH